MKKYIWIKIKFLYIYKSCKIIFFHHKFVTNFKLLKLIPFLKTLKFLKENNPKGLYQFYLVQDLGNF